MSTCLPVNSVRWGGVSGWSPVQTLLHCRRRHPHKGRQQWLPCCALTQVTVCIDRDDGVTGAPSAPTDSLPPEAGPAYATGPPETARLVTRSYGLGEGVGRVRGVLLQEASLRQELTVL